MSSNVWKSLEEKPDLHIQISSLPISTSSLSISSDTALTATSPLPNSIDDINNNTNDNTYTPKIHTSSSSSSTSAIPPLIKNTNTGLWNHSGLSQPQPKYKIIIAIILVLFGYGSAMLANGAASRFLTPRWLLLTSGTTITSNPLTGVGLAVSAADPVFLLSSFRVIATILLMLGMYIMNDLPAGFKQGIIKFPSFSQALVPIFIGTTNALGYLPYLVLTSCDGVSLWAALIGLYVIIPVTYGIIIRKESRNKRKLIGISICIIAGILLALPDPNKNPDTLNNTTGNMSEEIVPVWVKLLLFITCLGLWGACDGMVGFVGRDIHPFYVTLFSCLGFSFCAFICSWVSFIATAMAGPSILVSSSSSFVINPITNQTIPNTEDIIGPGGITGYFILFLAQILGIIAWYSSVRLGQMSEASAFLPITSLYTLLTSIGGVVVLHETLPVAGYIGIVMGGVGMLLIALS